MPTLTAKLPAASFKALVRAVLKFPPSAVVSSSEIVNLGVTKGRLRASVFGVVESYAGVVVTGTAVTEGMEPFAVDYRALAPYAELCPDAQVVIEIVKKDVCFTCGEHTLTIPFTHGRLAPKPITLGADMFVTSVEAAKTLRWLASIAEKDEAKPDMACVYCKAGRAMAGNQNCIAVSFEPDLPSGTYALPLNLCGVLEPEDKVTGVEGGLVVQSGCGFYSVPFQSETLKFPVSAIEKLIDAKGDLVGQIPAPALSEIFKESTDCVARVPKTTSHIMLTFEKDKLHALASSSTATYRTTAPLKDGKPSVEMYLNLQDAAAAIGVFDNDVISLKLLQPKNRPAMIGSAACVFYAPGAVSA